VIFTFLSTGDSGIVYSFLGYFLHRNMKKTRRKALGQHFLTNRETLHRIVEVIAPKAGDLIVEIGAGKGALTFHLAKSKAKIIALEKDKTLIPFLEKQEYANLIVLEKDALRVKFEDLLQGKPGKIVGNLPYSISSPLLFKVLEEKDFVSSCVFLLQKEVAQRVCASPGTKKYAPLSILFQNDFDTHLHFRVPASFFSPPPQVESALISLKKRHQPLSLVPHQAGFIKFLKGAFQSRRKKLTNNLKALGISPARIRETYPKCGIDEKSRPEQVSLSQFVALYTYLFDDIKTP
jgi:16S rRNA (adenine1518-N6/adenine1519-N6)-dimethyltransferase